MGLSASNRVVVHEVWNAKYNLRYFFQILGCVLHVTMHYLDNLPTKHVLKIFGS